jgi:hypothetical protein
MESCRKTWHIPPTHGRVRTVTTFIACRPRFVVRPAPHSVSRGGGYFPGREASFGRRTGRGAARRRPVLMREFSGRAHVYPLYGFTCIWPLIVLRHCVRMLLYHHDLPARVCSSPTASSKTSSRISIRLDSSTFAARTHKAAMVHGCARREAVPMKPDHAAMVGRFRSASSTAPLSGGLGDCARKCGKYAKREKNTPNH